jgi:uncharacterized protein (TIGR02270 family)
VNTAPKVVPVVIAQHVDDAVMLRNTRTTLVRAPHVPLRQLLHFDRRLEAHLAGIRNAGFSGDEYCAAILASPSVGAGFVAGIRAIEANDRTRLDQLFAAAEAVPALTRGLYSAFGWVSPEQLRGLVATLLESDLAFRRLAGLTACALHRVDSGLLARSQLLDTDSDIRSRALRSAGELGLVDATEACMRTLGSENKESALSSAWTMVLLGDRKKALDELATTSMVQKPHRAQAFRLSLQAMTVTTGHARLQSLRADPSQRRLLLEGSGIVGDPAYIPWLINQMTVHEMARLAGESFSLITGTDLAMLDLDGRPPENFESGPNDNPEDGNVDMDTDDGLPWPDVTKIDKWWVANSLRFPQGTRYFMGAPVTREHCIDVLKNGYQRQRILAAHYLCLLDPGTPLFNTSAPAWRQQRLLAQMA